MAHKDSGGRLFEIKDHVIPCLHLREDIVRTSLDDGADWMMSVRQYTPLDNLKPSEGDVTILGAPCLGFPKELYEPLWEELYHVLQKRGLRIRSIWTADPANLGSSGTLNSRLILEYANPSDYARDLFALVNRFPAEFLHPIVGIAHSIGATHLTQLSIIHPTLFTSLILMDPILVSNPGDGNAHALPAFTLKRPQVMPSRDLARMGFSRAFKKWDPRVLDLFMEHGLKDRSNEDGEGEVEMVAGRSSELANYIRPTHMQGRTEDSMTKGDEIEWCRTPIRTYAYMPMIAPPSLIVAGGNSVTSRKEIREDWERNYGRNDNFRNPGQVRNVVVDVVRDGSHFFPFEDPKDVADRIGGWVESMVGEGSRFERERKSVAEWRGLQDGERKNIIDGWMGEQKVKLMKQMSTRSTSKL